MDTAIAQYLMDYHIPGIFMGAFIFGETIIITAAFLATQGWWSLWTVFYISLLATVISDCVWFFAGYYVFEKKQWFKKYEHKYQKVVHFLDKKVGNRPYRGLLIVKFLYGTRILTIIYLARRRVNFWKFLFFDTIGSMLLMVVVVGIGYLAAKGYESVVHIFHNVTYVITGVIAVIILFKLVTIWLSKKVIEE